MDNVSKGIDRCSVPTKEWLFNLAPDAITIMLEQEYIRQMHSPDLLAIIDRLSYAIEPNPNLKNIASRERGVVGEDIIENILRSAFEQVDRVSLTAHSADLRVNNDILVEVKNYTGTVPSAEVDKFIRDLRSHAVSGGVMISMKSNIAKHKKLELLRIPQDGIEYVVGFISLTDYLWSERHADEFIILITKLVYETIKRDKWKISSDRFDDILTLVDELSRIIDVVVSAKEGITQFKSIAVIKLDQIMETLSLGTSLMRRTIEKIKSIINGSIVSTIAISTQEMIDKCYVNPEQVQLFLTTLDNRLCESIHVESRDGSVSPVSSKGCTWIQENTRTYRCQEYPISLTIYKSKTEMAILLNKPRSIALSDKGFNWTEVSIKNGELFLPVNTTNVDIMLHLLNM